MSGIKLVISNADFSQHALPISRAKGTPNATITSRDGSYSFTLANDGVAEISDTITHYGSGQDGMFGVYNATVDVGITEFSPLYWDTSSWESFYGTFMGLSHLQKVDLSHLNFESASDFGQMFESCETITKIIFPDIVSELGKSFSNTFGRCFELSELTFGNIANIVSLNSAFYNCWGLVNLDLSKLDLSHIVNVNLAFLNCEKLQELNLKQFKSDNITDYTGVFNGCTVLTKIYVDDPTSAQWLITNCLSVNTVTSAYNWSYDSVNKVINRGSAI